VGEPRPYRGVGAEVRRAQRRAALIETGLDCLDADGLGGVSVRSICARARLTPRYFYESFADLDELLIAVVDTVAAEIATHVVAAVAAAPDQFDAQVRALVSAAFDVVSGDPRKANSVLVAASGHPALRHRRSEIAMDYAEIAMSNLPALAARSAAERREVRATTLFLLGGSVELIVAVLSGGVRLSRTRVVALLTDMWTSVLAERAGVHG